MLNVAVGERVTLNQVYAVLRKITGATVEPAYGPPRPGDILHSLADIRQARAVLGYEPKVLLEEGLQRTVAWYKENRKRFYPG